MMRFRCLGLALLATLVCVSIVAQALAADVPWRIRLREAAVVSGPTVLLGEVSEPVGQMPPDVWRELAARPLWPSPVDAGRPMIVNKVRLGQALRSALGDTADLCLLPSSMALQRGGTVLRDDDLRALVVRTMTPQLGSLGGEASFSDFRLPPYAFLEHQQQQVVLEPLQPAPGRLSLRFAVVELDGRVVRRFTGTAFLDLWMTVPCAAQPLNRGDRLDVDKVTWARKNIAYLRAAPWDGRGGPWQLQRPVGAGQVVYQDEVAPNPAVQRGSILTLLYESSALRLAVQAEALADGMPGETIQVRNLQSRKQVYATVRDGSTVVVR